MTEDQRWDYIYRMIDDAVTGHRARRYLVNRAEIARCLEREVESMYWNFEDTCADPRTARAQAIRNSFKKYIWTCVN